MDGRNFDGLARALAAAPRRRLLISGGLALAGALVGRGVEAAPCRKVGQTCNFNNRCCSRSRCIQGKCRCRVGLGFRNCGDGFCVDTKTSEQHCGACGRKCPPNKRCVNGNCV